MNSFGNFHWISYFFVTYILFSLFYLLYHFLDKSLVCRYLMLCGQYSYEIFLFQMIFFIVSPVNLIFKKFIRESIWLEPLSLLINVVCCTIPTVVVMKLKYIRKDNHVQS